MTEIDDTGKVWIKGKFSPEYALRVGTKVIVPGEQEDDKLTTWVSDNALWTDIHCPEQKRRILRKFALDLAATTPATLFNGFTKTKHADVEVITSADSGVREVKLEGEEYVSHHLEKLDSQQFLEWVNINSKWGDK
jgi:hypothetical protein